MLLQSKFVARNPKDDRAKGGGFRNIAAGTSVRFPDDQAVITKTKKKFPWKVTKNERYHKVNKKNIIDETDKKWTIKILS